MQRFSHKACSVLEKIFKGFSHTNAQGSKLDLAVKKVKQQCTTILLAMLVDLQSPMIPAEVQPQGMIGSEEEDF